MSNSEQYRNDIIIRNNAVTITELNGTTEKKITLDKIGTHKIIGVKAIVYDLNGRQILSKEDSDSISLQIKTNEFADKKYAEEPLNIELWSELSDSYNFTGFRIGESTEISLIFKHKSYGTASMAVPITIEYAIYCTSEKKESN